MAITKEQLEKGTVLSSVTYWDGTTIPFYYETGMLGNELKEIITDAMGKYQAITIKDVEIELSEVMNVRDWITGNAIYFNSEGDKVSSVLTKESFEDMSLRELYESLTDLSELIMLHYQDDDIEDAEGDALTESEFECIWELGKRLGFRKDYNTEGVK